MANHTRKTPEIVEAICARLAKGEPLAVICRDEDMPAARTVRDWIAQDAEVFAAIGRAREDGEEVILAECLTIADTPEEGVVERWEPVKVADPEKPDAPEREELRLVERRVEDRLHHRKLRIWTRLQLLAKWNPRKYGESMTHRGDPRNPVHVRNSARDYTEAELLAMAAVGDKDGGNG